MSGKLKKVIFYSLPIVSLSKAKEILCEKISKPKNKKHATKTNKKRAR